MEYHIIWRHTGFYIGTIDDNGYVTRVSEETWETKVEAEDALALDAWTLIK